MFLDTVKNLRQRIHQSVRVASFEKFTAAVVGSMAQVINALLIRKLIRRRSRRRLWPTRKLAVVPRGVTRMTCVIFRHALQIT